METNKFYFETDKLELKPLTSRRHDLDMSSILPINASSVVHENILEVAKSIVNAQKKNASIILMMGAHVIRSGVQRYIIDLMKHGTISCIAMNGAGMIHDYELALIGATTESVSGYIRDGSFGFWQETSGINDIVNQAFGDGLGMGNSVGRAILDGKFFYKESSILAQAAKYKVPVTIHVGIGCDIIHQAPNFSGAATGETSYKDFLTFACMVKNLENGVVMNFGSAVMAPEVFLKALSMARNVARQERKTIAHFTTLVCDLHDLPEDYSKEAPKGSAAYFFRPWKTMLVRTVADGGNSYYVKGRHSDTIPALWTAVRESMTQDDN